ncbi:MAG: aldehyde dehydrogenase family protein [Anaerolineae bacterium]|jgi:acyl-CoA reductase-like NAD-dependent aldehyde dehydrogenase|nr:aldehyde dehydrogenase family protein [Anaerolineae bacterium]
MSVLQVINPYNEQVIAELSETREEEVRAAIGRAVNAGPKMAQMPAFRRARILNTAAELIEADAKNLTELMAKESGKPLKFARGEVSRAVETFGFAAEESKRIHGETIPMDAAKNGVGRFGYYLRVPIGVVAAITPFNFPLNLVAHKVAPAIAAGCAIVLKPAPATPLTALRLQEILLEAGLPTGAFEVVIGDRAVGQWLTTDPRVAMISFTGSPPVAHAISQAIGLRKAVYELGGNAAVIIDQDADLDRAVDGCVIGSFAYSGQVCISVQRIYVHESRYAEFRDRFQSKTARLILGDPLNDQTDIGPMITEAAAQRAQSWVQEAIDRDAKLVIGGERQGRTMIPTVLEQVSPDLRVMREEVFAPVVNLIPFSDFEQALTLADESPYGLQAGVYTRDLGKALQAVQRLNVGGVMINDVPTFRADHMPYGGNKSSGIGREGPRFAIEDMTTLRMVVINV